MIDSLPGRSAGLRRARRARRSQDLMRHRVRRILLVSSLYESFILTEDGHLNEALLRQCNDLNLSANPDLTRVSSGAEALALAADDHRFDMIVASLQLGDMNAAELARQAKTAGVDIPIVLLAYNNRALTDFLAKHDRSGIDRIFLWQGDVRILLAMAKDIEDRANVAHDTGELGVPAIIVVEDNIRFYSSFLPVIYTEVMKHSHELISEGLNLSQKMLRYRARPKILLCEDFETAWDFFSAYKESILGVISDIEFPLNGQIDRRAGVELASRIRRIRPDIPIVLQSSIPENEALANSLDASFLLKGSPVLLHRLREVLTDRLGLGDFVFRRPDGIEIDRASDLKSLVSKLRTVDVKSIVFHGERNHFSMWLKARTEFALAERLRPLKVAEFASTEQLRQALVRSISSYRLNRDRAVVADFDRATFDGSSSIARIGGGSLGGKARGLAFINRLLLEADIHAKFSGIDICVPPCVVLGTDVFDNFLETNRLGDLALDTADDAEIEKRIVAAPFPAEVLDDLRAFLERADYPLAVRSSGLLEDSPSQPFAGVYRTFMLANRGPDVEYRLANLVTAVKQVYASTFSSQAKAFLRMTPFRLEEEKMAVIIQKIVGETHDTRFYPDISGVGRSHNFYPAAPMNASDGTVAVALGFGRTVVDGSACLRFCPKYPRHLVSFTSVDGFLENSQRQFYALNLDEPSVAGGDEGAELTACALDVAEQDGTLSALASTYSPENDTISDGMSRAGVRLVSFAPILKQGVFPLAELLDVLLDIGRLGTGADVEIEFAVNLAVPAGERPVFGFLQMRPMALSTEMDELQIGEVSKDLTICRSDTVMGNGRVDLTDIVVVDYHRFLRSKSAEVAQQVTRLNATLQAAGVPYVLIGVGRWGSTDPHLGIPIAWNQVAGARVIVESGFKDMRVTPSQGSHFFQNLTSCNVGYFTVNPTTGDGFIDWEWLTAQAALEDTGFVRHIRLEHALTVKMNGATGEGVILKPPSAA